MSNLPAPMSSAGLPVTGDWLDSTHIPLDVAQAFTEEQADAVLGWLSEADRYGEHLRLGIGAYLHSRRASFGHGEWTAYVTAKAEIHKVTTRTLGNWMVAAERHYHLGLPKAAKPTRRAPIGTASKTKPVSPPDAAPSPDATAPSPGCNLGGRDSTGDVASDIHADKAGADIGIAAGHDGSGLDRPAPGPKSPTTPTRGRIDGRTRIDRSTGVPVGPVQAALDAVLLAPAVELAILARNERTKVTAAHRALGRALADAKPAPAEDFDPDECTHPRDKRNVKPYATICDACGLRLS